MRAAVIHKPKDIRCDNVPDPKIEDPRDAILEVTHTAICGSDLHLYNGALAQPKSMIMGHEFMGVVEEVGRDVRNLRRGDRVVVPFPIACGRCWFCEHGWPTHCERSNVDHYGPEGGLLRQKGGGLFGYSDLYGGYDGGQAEYARVPFADYGPRKVPEGLSDEQVLFLTDIFPTGSVALEWANLRAGESLAVFGCGPVGLMALKAARLRGADPVFAVDLVPERLAMARKVADATAIDVSDINAVEAIRDGTHGRGADVCVDAVGLEVDRSVTDKILNVLRLQRGSITAVELCFSAVRRGGRVSIMGVYVTDYDNFPLGQMLDKGLTVRIGQAPVQAYIDKLMEQVAIGKVRLDDIITHRLPLSEVAHAYEIFNGKKEGCVKVVLTPSR